MAFSVSIEKLIEEFEKLPGIGHKTAVRLAFHVLNSSNEDAKKFADTIIEAKKIYIIALFVIILLMLIRVRSVQMLKEISLLFVWSKM